MTVVKSDYELTKNELYETDYWATEAVLKYINVQDLNIWEPCAGNHKIADILRFNGANVITSDIETYNRQHDFMNEFIESNYVPEHIDMIVTNPPFGSGNRIAAKIARLCLERCNGIVILLLTAKFDFGSSRKDLFENNSRFFCKITLTDRIKWFKSEKDITGTEDHAWYVWTAKNMVNENPLIFYQGNPYK